MKNISKYVFILFAVFSSSLLSAQSPGKFNYQAVIRNSAGQPLVSTAVGVRFQIYNQLVGGSQVYQEDFAATTNAFGVVNLAVGTAPTLGDLKSLNWGGSTFFVNIQMGTGGTYTDISASRTQLVSVPYSLFASKADTANVATSVIGGGTPAGSIIAWGGTTAPTGWLLCDGQSYNNSDYPNLRAAIGINFGGTGSAFNVPDFRGRFLRGLDTRTSGGNDPDNTSRTAMQPGGNAGANVGSLQDDKLKDHQHSVGADVSASATYNRPAMQLGNNANSTLSTSGVLNNFASSETRPKNVYVNYIIKY